MYESCLAYYTLNKILSLSQIRARGEKVDNFDLIRKEYQTFSSLVLYSMNHNTARDTTKEITVPPIMPKAGKLQCETII